MRARERYTDAELIAAISAGRDLDNAIRFLYRQYSQATSSFIIQHGGSEQDADDIFQETVVAFIEVVQKGKYRMEASVKTFLNSIAKNYWFNEIKKRERSGLRDRKFEAGRDKDEIDVSHYIVEMERKRQLRDPYQRSHHTPYWPYAADAAQSCDTLLDTPHRLLAHNAHPRHASETTQFSCLGLLDLQCPYHSVNFYNALWQQQIVYVAGCFNIKPDRYFVVVLGWW